MEQFFTLALHQFGDRDPGPLCHDPGDFLFGHRVMDQCRPAALLTVLFRLFKFPLECGKIGVFQSGRLLIFITQLRVFDLSVKLLDLSLEVFNFVHAVFLCFPARFGLVEAVFQIGQFLGDLFQAFTAEPVIFLFERHLLNFELHDPAAHIVQFRRHGIDFCTDQGAGFIHKVDGLVREKTVADIAIGQSRRGNKCAVMDPDAVVDLITFLQSAQDGNRVLHCRLIHLDRLEPSLQSRIFLNVLAVFVQGRGPDAVELSPCQHRLEKVPGIHTAFRPARADNGMQFIDEKDDPAFTAADLLQDRLQPFFKLPSVLCACNQCAHVQRKDRLAFQSFRYVSPDDSLGKPLCDRRLADTRLSDQDRVVLCFPGKDPDYIPDLRIPPDHRIQFVFSGPLHQICSVLRKGIIGILRIISRDGSGFHFCQFGRKCRSCDGMIREDPFDGRGRRRKNAEHQVFHGDISVSALLCSLFCCIEDFSGLGRHIQFTVSAAHARKSRNHCVQLRENRIAVYAHFPEKRRDQPAVLVDQRVKQVLRCERAVAVFFCHRPRCLQRIDAFLCKILCIHQICTSELIMCE